MMKRSAGILTILVLCAGLVLPALAQTTPKRIRGTIQALQDNVLTVAANNGETVKVHLAPNYTVGAIVQTTPDKVKPGTKIGIVGFGPPKQQRAAVISIFPADANVNESQFAWDTQPDSVMTNAPVTADVSGVNGRLLTVSIKGEPVEVTVPQNVIVQETEPGAPAMLVPGAKVLIFAQQAADGTVSAPRVNVGKDGWTPAN
jgi:preprotein translocase subunit YajC